MKDPLWRFTTVAYGPLTCNPDRRHRALLPAGRLPGDRDQIVGRCEWRQDDLGGEPARTGCGIRTLPDCDRHREWLTGLVEQPRRAGLGVGADRDLESGAIGAAELKRAGRLDAIPGRRSAAEQQRTSGRGREVAARGVGRPRGCARSGESHADVDPARPQGFRQRHRHGEAFAGRPRDAPGSVAPAPLTRSPRCRRASQLVAAALQQPPATDGRDRFPSAVELRVDEEARPGRTRSSVIAGAVVADRGTAGARRAITFSSVAGGPLRRGRRCPALDANLSRPILPSSFWFVE